MMSSAWGYDFSCCSDRCGFAFAEKHKNLDKTKKGRRQLSDLWEKLQDQSDYRLSGEPYYGYSAEQLLRSLGRRK